MSGLKPYNIPVKTAGLGVHKYDFEINKDFFKTFEESPLSDGNFKVAIEMDKRPNIIELNFNIEGDISAPCDVCLAEINIPVLGENRILVKYSEIERADEEEIIYISPDDPFVNVANLIYEFIILAIPISKRIDCEANDYQYCDQKVLEYLDQLEVEEEDEKDEEDRNIWDSLKDIKFN